MPPGVIGIMTIPEPALPMPTLSEILRRSLQCRPSVGALGDEFVLPPGPYGAPGDYYRLRLGPSLMRRLCPKSAPPEDDDRGGPCEFYLAWCEFGIIAPGKGRWTKTFDACEKCYAKCVDAGNKWDSWPFGKCPIAGTDPTRESPGPRWPRPDERFPWDPTWPD
jgi:hypothetical protein